MYTTTTAQDWETERPGAEREVAKGRANVKGRMLAQIAEAGAEGVPAADLITMSTNRYRALGVRDQLQQEALVVTEWERDDAALGGKVCVYRLATEEAQS